MRSSIPPMLKQDVSKFLEKLDARLLELSQRMDSGLRKLESGLEEIYKKQDSVLLRLRSDLDSLLQKISVLTTKVLELERRVEALEQYIRNHPSTRSKPVMG